MCIRCRVCITCTQNPVRLPPSSFEEKHNGIESCKCYPTPKMKGRKIQKQPKMHLNTLLAYFNWLIRRQFKRRFHIRNSIGWVHQVPWKRLHSLLCYKKCLWLICPPPRPPPPPPLPHTHTQGLRFQMFCLRNM